MEVQNEKIIKLLGVPTISLDVRRNALGLWVFDYSPKRKWRSKIHDNEGVVMEKKHYRELKC